MSLRLLRMVTLCILRACRGARVGERAALTPVLGDSSMLNSIFPHDTDVVSALRYCLSTIGRSAAEPKVVLGDPKGVIAAVDVIVGKSKFISGVLSFAEPKVPLKVICQIVREHLAVMFPGVDSRELAYCYILHRDKGRVEIHYLIAKVHLLTGKRLGYHHKIDRKRLRLWVQTINDRFGFADPNDPRRWRLYSPANRNSPKSRLEKQTSLLEGLARMAAAGAVRKRADIERELIKAGWQISRRTKNAISVTAAGIKYPIRLAGAMFSEAWGGALSSKLIAELSECFHRERIRRLESTASSLVPHIQKRALYNSKRFGARGLKTTAALLSRLKSHKGWQTMLGHRSQEVLALGLRLRQSEAPASRAMAVPTTTMRF